MVKYTVTAGELIAALSKFPADTPVFGYSYLDECDVPIEVCEIFPGPVVETDEVGDTFMYPPHGCQGDSYVERHWLDNGPGPVIYLRDRNWSDNEIEPKPIIFT